MTKKERLLLGIEVLQRFGREGTIVLDRLLKERPELDREGFLVEVENRLRKET